jgi:hypothetical protein
MIPRDMLDSLKDHLDAPDNFWSNKQLWRRLTDATAEVVRDIAKEDATYFVQTADISTVADQATYDLPLNARLGSRIIFAENTDDPSGVEIPPTRLRELLDFSLPGIVGLSGTYQFTLQGSKVRIIPTPTSTVADAIRVYFIPNYGNMIQGTASAGTSTTLTFFTGDPNWTTNYGEPDVRDDFYNGMQILIYDGTGVGQQREITDYSGGSTRRVTVDSAWSVTPDTTSKFAIMCPIPEDHHSVVVTRAALSSSIKGRTRNRELHREYYGHLGAPGVLKDLLGWVQKRQDAQLETVIPYNIGA